MESHGLAGRVQVSESTHALISDSFDCTPRGTIEVKGKGPMQPWIVDGSKPGVSAVGEQASSVADPGGSPRDP
jgi:class 3 adenylate cyclase